MDFRRQHCSQSGVSILEVTIAGFFLTVVSVALLNAFTMAVGQNKTQGEIGTRVTEYAQDKMEQLLALSYSDTTSNTASSTYPAPSTGGTGLSDGGGINPASPVANYVDYLASDGTLQGGTSTSTTFYKRLWQISSASNLKTITVFTTAVNTAGGRGKVPTTTLVSFKSNTQ